MKTELLIICNHNFDQLKKVDFDQSAAKNLFTISHNHTEIYDFYLDESLMNDVDPLRYYGIEKLEKVIAAFKEWKK